MAYVKFFEEKLFCVFSFCGVKKKLVVCRDDLISFLAVVALILKISTRVFFLFFSSFVLREAKVNAFQWIL